MISRTNRNSTFIVWLLMPLLVGLWHSNGHTEEVQTMILDGQVQGQQSQPNMLFILPWEHALERESLDDQEIQLSEDDFLAPVDRRLLQRQLNLYQQIKRQ